MNSFARKGAKNEPQGLIEPEALWADSERKGYIPVFLSLNNPKKVLKIRKLNTYKKKEP